METPVELVQIIGAVLAGIFTGAGSMLVQLLIQQLIPYLGQEQADKLSSSLNVLGALIIPVALAYGLSYVAQMAFGIAMDPWSFYLYLLAAVGGGQTFYEVRARR